MPLGKLIRSGFLVLAAAFLMPAANAASGAEEGELSDAQVLLFRTPHLDGIDRPTTVEYEYRRDAGDEKGFVDTVAIDITEVAADGGKDVKVDFLTGPRARNFGTFDGFRGNPLIMVFLEDDVQRMGEDLGGGSLYMRNRIRHAFYDGATTAPVTFQVDGRTVDGTQVSVAPFVGDKNRDRLGTYERKVYEFIVSPAVPGGIYRIHSYVPSGTEAGRPLAEDTLTYRGARS